MNNRNICENGIMNLVIAIAFLVLSILMTIKGASNFIYVNLNIGFWANMILFEIKFDKSYSESEIRINKNYFEGENYYAEH